MKAGYRTSQPSIFLTGANGGIGSEICKAFKTSGYFVIASDRHENASNPCDFYIKMDLATYLNDESLRRNLSKAIKKINEKAPLKCLINNAATQITGLAETLSAQDINTSFQVNVMAAFALIQDCAPVLEVNGGSVINISSIHAHLTKPGFSAYAASKAALSGLTRALAVELGSRVRINAIEPAAIDTPMLREGFANNIETFGQLERYHPTNKIGSPKQIADLCVTLAASTAAFINGSIITMDGGISSRLHDPF